MKDLLSELTQARYQAAGGATDEAQRHITKALELLDDAIAVQSGPKPSARSIRAYITDAQLAVKSGDSSRAVTSLGSAIEALDYKPDSTAREADTMARAAKLAAENEPPKSACDPAGRDKPEPDVE